MARRRPTQALPTCRRRRLRTFGSPSTGRATGRVCRCCIPTKVKDVPQGSPQNTRCGTYSDPVRKYTTPLSPNRNGFWRVVIPPPHHIQESELWVDRAGPVPLQSSSLYPGPGIRRSDPREANPPLSRNRIADSRTTRDSLYTPSIRNKFRIFDSDGFPNGRGTKASGLARSPTPAMKESRY